MKNQGKIDHLIFGLYIREEYGNSSNIKFGGWDPSALQPGASLITFRTYSPQHWDLKADNFMIDGKAFLSDVRIISIDPHIPYLYIPNNDWNDFAREMSLIYADIVCEFSANRCYFT